MDKSIPYYAITMVRPPDAPPIEPVKLPGGYTYRMYRPGDEAAWAEIETAAGEFDRQAQALALFEEVFLPYPKALEERMVFILGSEGVAVGNAALWWLDDPQYGRIRRLHWVAVHPSEQGMGLGRAVCSLACRIVPADGSGDAIWLSTQTWSWRAIELYLSLGFRAHKTHCLGEKNEYEAAARILADVMRNASYERFVATAID